MELVLFMMADYLTRDIGSRGGVFLREHDPDLSKVRIEENHRNL